jgi:hypothetical protein
VSEYAYVGFGVCGHATYLAVDDGAPSNADGIASVIRKGGRIERMTVEAARAVTFCRCTPAERWGTATAKGRR